MVVYQPDVFVKNQVGIYDFFPILAKISFTLPSIPIDFLFLFCKKGSFMFKKISTILIAMAISSTVNAGVNGYTNHSRANCVNNESISWDWTQNWWLITRSEHYNLQTGELRHTLQTPEEFTWRSAAVHWAEGGSGWKVHGTHWRKHGDGKYYVEDDEWVTDCSVYDGWWDRNK
jgi:hypothetical protein